VPARRRRDRDWPSSPVAKKVKLQLRQHGMSMVAQPFDIIDFPIQNDNNLQRRVSFHPRRSRRNADWLLSCPHSSVGFIFSPPVLRAFFFPSSCTDSAGAYRPASFPPPYDVEQVVRLCPLCVHAVGFVSLELLFLA